MPRPRPDAWVRLLSGLDQRNKFERSVPGPVGCKEKATTGVIAASASPLDKRMCEAPSHKDCATSRRCRTHSRKRCKGSARRERKTCIRIRNASESGSRHKAPKRRASCASAVLDPRADAVPNTSTRSNYYTGLKVRAKKHFYGPRSGRNEF